ncbi:hypothetical protein POV27_08575 [Aureisphaera galaxeae]|uniref:hypothetical protein n=1 Tax=Aureisphaera galaxeae TaxID=1538023 RepID=UPI0023500DB2|nr:hypothetical protein [Aureisphaera galaxeae]MDC8004106.1 hypothetical protein [Aureisphaera galaxeae]
MIIWKGIEIGVFHNSSMDMGYLDGTFLPNNTTEAQRFITVASSLNPKETMIDPRKSFYAFCKEKDKENEAFKVIVIGLINNLELCVKWVVGKQEVHDWVEQNVPEDLYPEN